MAFALIANNSGTGDTTTAVDSTGANLLIAFAASVVAGTISDSKGNSWTQLTEYATGTRHLSIWYSIPTSVGSGHTATVTGATFPSTYFAAFSGGAAASVFDQENGAGGSTAVQSGPITPSQNDCLVIAAHLHDAAGTATIDGGFTIANQVAFSSGARIGGALAYLIQTSAAAANPTWNDLGNNICAIASFKPAAGGGFIDNTQSILNCINGGMSC